MAEMQNKVFESTKQKIENCDKFLLKVEHTAMDYDRILEIYKAGQTDIIISLLDDIAESLRVLSEREEY